MFKKNIKSQKTLKHLNDVYYVFRQYTIEKNIIDPTPYIQLMLKNYIEDKDKLIPEETIKLCKESILGTTEIQGNETIRN